MRGQKSQTEENVIRVRNSLSAAEPFLPVFSSTFPTLQSLVFTFPTHSGVFSSFLSTLWCRKHTLTHISGFHPFYSVCIGSALTNHASNGPCPGEQAGRKGERAAFLDLIFLWMYIYIYINEHDYSLWCPCHTQKTHTVFKKNVYGNEDGPFLKETIYQTVSLSSFLYSPLSAKANKAVNVFLFLIKHCDFFTLFKTSLRGQ